MWNFKERAELTDAGHALWKDAGLNVNELALPLAVRGTPEITGIVDEDKLPNGWNLLIPGSRIN